MLGVLPMGAIEDVPDFVRSLLAVCRSVGCNIRVTVRAHEVKISDTIQNCSITHTPPQKHI